MTDYRPSSPIPRALDKDDAPSLMTGQGQQRFHIMAKPSGSAGSLDCTCYRVTKGGQPTFDKIFHTPKLLQRHKIPFNMLTCVNRYNAKHPADVYRFLRSEVGSGSGLLCRCYGARLCRRPAAALRLTLRAQPRSTKAARGLKMNSPLNRLWLVIGLIAAGLNAPAQNLEPRAYANTPVGMNFLLTGYAYTEGPITANASSPIQGANVQTDTALAGYSRSFGLWGKSAKAAVVAGEAWASGTAAYVGQPHSRDIAGPIDPLFKFSVNLYGAPALTMNEFTNYHQNLIVGVSLGVTAPLGQYDSSKLLNIGNNRWSFNPELGFSKAVGHLTLELMPGVTVFTDNDNFLGQVRQQDPLYSLQGHVIYSFGRGFWASLSGTYYTGGTTTVGGTDQSDLERNYRVGGTLALPLGRRESIKLYGSDGLWARAGANFWLVGIAFQYRWGGGL